VHGPHFPEGTQYLEGKWLEVEHSKASTGNRHYMKGVSQGDPALVMSHLVICKAEVTAVQKGRRCLYTLKEDEHDSILAHLTEANTPSESESESGSDESEEEEEEEKEEEEERGGSRRGGRAFMKEGWGLGRRTRRGQVHMHIKWRTRMKRKRRASGDEKGEENERLGRRRERRGHEHGRFEDRIPKLERNFF
jgi:hypothetical protein